MPAARAELESRVSALEQELDSERVAKRCSSLKLNTDTNRDGSGDATAAAASESSDEVAKLTEEIQRLQARFTEATQFEERRRAENTEQWKAQLEELQVSVECDCG